MCCVSLHFMDCMSDVDGYLKDTVVELVDYLENSGAVRSEAGKVMAAKLKSVRQKDIFLEKTTSNVII